jgi:hypothetical protein
MYTLSCHVHLFGTKGYGINELVAISGNIKTREKNGRCKHD